jgi:RimJ/RimL family protein N-acetyltransferase
MKPRIDKMVMTKQPLGKLIEDTSSMELPDKQGFKGKFVELQQVDPKRQVTDLFAASSGSREKEAVWTYLPYAGPFANAAQMEAWLRLCRDHPDFIFYAVYDTNTRQYVGMTSFCSIVPDMQRLEVGFIWYTPESQRTRINTESIYLMLCEAFDRLKYRRVEWKCDALNQPSRNAALRLGFRFEGIFRKHMIVNGRNRDTAWFAMTDLDWPAIKINMENWLYHSGEYFSLREANRPLVESDV